MKCPNRGQLQGLIDDALPKKRKNAIEAHLRHCQKCQSELDTMRSSLLLVKEELKGLDPRTVPAKLFDPSRVEYPDQSQYSAFLRVIRASVRVPAVSLILGAVAIIGLTFSLFLTHRQLMNLRLAAEGPKPKSASETIFISSPSRYQAYKLDIKLDDYRPIRDPQVVLFKEEIQ